MPAHASGVPIGARNPGGRGIRRQGGATFYVRDGNGRGTQTQSGTSRPRRQHGRHLDRVVRLLPLRHGGRARVPEAVLPGLEPLRRRARLVRHLRRRLCRAAGRRGDLRPLGRPHRPQGDADLDAAADGRRQLPDRRDAHLRLDRHLGADAAGRPAPAAGHRRRRRVGRLDHAVDGVGQPAPARPRRQLAAGRRADRPAAVDRRGLADQPPDRRRVRDLGLADPVPGQRAC